MANVRNCKDIGENLQLIAKRLIANQDICKLCKYTDKDPLGHPDLTEKEQRELLHDLIRIEPRLPPQETANSYITIVVKDGEIEDANTEFRNIRIVLYVWVPILQWIVKSDNLRPFLILGAVQDSLNNKKINGLGKMIGGDFSLNNVTEDMSCYVIEFHMTNYA